MHRNYGAHAQQKRPSTAKINLKNSGLRKVTRIVLSVPITFLRFSIYLLLKLPFSPFLIPWLSLDLSLSFYLLQEWTLDQFSSVAQSDSLWPCVTLCDPLWLFVTPCITAHQASLSITNSQSSHKPMSIESVIPSNHLILCHPLLLLPPILDPRHNGILTTHYKERNNAICSNIDGPRDCCT